ncbi:MAG TPA: hypothetical protein PKM65_14110 [Spirochaetota bacterium]|nr:hypothetical protein [Spirochaetota bacterium]HNT12934.1 hypothetical protein [Spirochaetota bacterium]
MDPEIAETIAKSPELARKYQIALHYTNGDEDKALKMLDGAYQDLYIIKGRFSSTTQNGLFVIFYNWFNFVAVSTSEIMSPSYMLRNVDPSQDWREFERQLMEHVAKGDHDEVMRRAMRDAVLKAFTVTIMKDVNKAVRNNDDIVLNRIFQRLIKDSMGLQNVDMEVNCQPDSSLAMELDSITSKKIDVESIAKNASRESESAVAPPADGFVRPEVGKDGVKLILKCGLILSPIKGKHISRLEVGDRVRVSILESSPNAIKVAEAFNAYDGKQFSPINARMKVARKGDKGYEFYAVIAKGILAHVVEEEENIKVAMDPAFTVQESKDETKKGGISMPIIVAIIAAFIIIVSVLIFLVK